MCLWYVPVSPVCLAEWGLVLPLAGAMQDPTPGWV